MQDGDVHLKIKGLIENQPFEAGQPSTITNRFDGGGSIGNYPDNNETPIAWDFSDPWTMDNVYSSADISPIIQGLLDGQTATNGITPDHWINLLFLTNGTSDSRTAWSFEGNDSKAAKLCITYEPPTLQGEMVYLSQPSANIQDITVGIKPIAIDHCLNGPVTVPVVDGNFEYDLCGKPAQYRIQPSKTTEPLCGLNALDVSHICQHADGFATLYGSHHRIAADVNGDGYITHADANSLIDVLNSTASLNPSWTFIADDEEFIDNLPGVPTYHNKVEGTYSKALDNQLDFSIVKMGDVNSSCTYSVSTCCDDVMLFEIPGGSVNTGQIFDLPLNAKNFKNLQAYQLGLSFDPNELELMSVEEGNLENGALNANWNVTDSGAGKIVTTWHDCPSGVAPGGGSNYSITLPEGETIFYLRFKALTNITDVSTTVTLDDNLLANRFYARGKEFGISSPGGLSGGFTNGSSDGRAITEITRKGLNKAPECFPNPVTDELSIQLQLLNDGPVTIQVYDGMGKMMMAENFLLESGTEQLQLKKIANWANGIYHYVIYVDGIPYHGTFLKAGN